jgi:uncharacterized damage-inducible protein DinB
MRTLLVLTCLVAAALAAWSQERPTAEQPKAASTTPEKNPLSAENRRVYKSLKAILLRTAEQVPEEKYSFKATDAVRSFGQIIGHLAEAQYRFCALVLGEESPRVSNEKDKTSKADLITALKNTFSYCDRAYDGLTDASATQMVKLWGETSKLGALTLNNMHITTHYGNLVTYMRLMNIVPPSSDPVFMEQLRK